MEKAYDPEAHAEKTIRQLAEKTDLRNSVTGVTRDTVRYTSAILYQCEKQLTLYGQTETYMSYWLPPGNLKVKSFL